MRRIWSAEFWQRNDEFVAGIKTVTDRPKGSAHPRFSDAVCVTVFRNGGVSMKGLLIRREE